MSAGLKPPQVLLIPRKSDRFGGCQGVGRVRIRIKSPKRIPSVHGKGLSFLARNHERADTRNSLFRI